MGPLSITDQQISELCDRISKMLIEKIESDTVQDSIDETIRDFVSKNNLTVDFDNLSNSIQVSVKVQMSR